MSERIDIHCHLLAGIDDGPPDLDCASQLAKGLVALGYKEIYPTPHQNAGYFAPSPSEVRQAFEALEERLAAERVDIRLHPPAGENMWDEMFLERQANNSYPTYPGGRAFLLELPPYSPPPTLKQRLFEFRLAGKLPILAHVERYPDLLREDHKQLEELADTAGILVNLGSLGGKGGWGMKRVSRRLVEKGLVHALTTDAHRPADLDPCEKGIQWLKTSLGEAACVELLEAAPAKLVRGELP